MSDIILQHNTKRRRLTAGIFCVILVIYPPVLVLADLPRTFAAPASASTPNRIKSKKSTTSTVIIPNDRLVSFLCNLRGGNGNRNERSNDGSRNKKNKLKSISIRHQQVIPLVLRRFCSFGTKSWKFALEGVNSRTSNKKCGNGSRNVVKTTAATKNNSKEKKASGKIRQDSLNGAAGYDHIDLRKREELPISTSSSKLSHYSPFRMYYSCMGIVSLWILTGTFFYSYTNEWPIPQSFFYAVDAGMSIGFCTEVAEIKLVSKAFTIVYILLGASVVGGALALFIQDIVEGVVDRERKNNSNILTKEYELMLEKEAFERIDVSHTGTLTKDEFSNLLRSTSTSTSGGLSEDDIDILWTKFDRIKDGAIHFEEFAGTYRGIEGLIDSLHYTHNVTANRTYFDKQDEDKLTVKILKWISSLASSISCFVRPFLKSENRIYVVFLAWVFIGVAWGMMNQGWDLITATHFAISALATGGLTAPPVNNNGILPAQPSIFCGFYCLFGIPLMAIAFGNFARVLVSDHVAAMEKWALTRPMTATDYEIAKQYLLKTAGTKADSHPKKSILKRRRQQEASSSSSTVWQGLRLSDFIVLQLLRQGIISVETIDILRKEFELLDVDETGLLTLEEATNWSTASVTKGRDEEITPLPI